MGDRVVDVALLKKYTTYNSSVKQQTRDWFWEVFEEMDEADKRLYLKFVNGRAKLPANIANISYKHQITPQGSSDSALPQAHVCYFQIDLPNYSTKAILEKRLLTAIRFCGEIDTD